MELLNHISKAEVRNQKVFETFLTMLSPFAPFLTEELCRTGLGRKESIFKQAWPEYFEDYTKRQTVEYVVQINGKVRARLNIEAGLSPEEIEPMIMEDPQGPQNGPKARSWSRRSLYPDKLANLVVK